MSFDSLNSLYRFLTERQYPHTSCRVTLSLTRPTLAILKCALLIH